jgi:hypothetical protein
MVPAAVLAAFFLRDIRDIVIPSAAGNVCRFGIFVPGDIAIRSRYPENYAHGFKGHTPVNLPGPRYVRGFL